MPETEDTAYDVPIPLRDNESHLGLRAASTPQPNPYSRLEAVTLVRGRLGTLIDLLKSRRTPADGPGLLGTLVVLFENLDVAVNGDAESVEDLVDGQVPVPMWMDAVVEVLWPSVGGSGDTGSDPGA